MSRFRSKVFEKRLREARGIRSEQRRAIRRARIPIEERMEEIAPTGLVKRAKIDGRRCPYSGNGCELEACINECDLDLRRLAQEEL